MTTATCSNPRPSLLPRLLLVALVVTVLAAVIETPVGRIKTRAHSEKHAEAGQIRECLAQNGAQQQWQDNEHPSVHYFCVELEPCPRWAVLIAQIWPSVVDDCDWRERSAFVVRGGEPSRVEQWLARIAERIR